MHVWFMKLRSVYIMKVLLVLVHCYNIDKALKKKLHVSASLAAGLPSLRQGAPLGTMIIVFVGFIDELPAQMACCCSFICCFFQPCNCMWSNAATHLLNHKMLLDKFLN